VISGFRRDADEIFALLKYNAALSGNPLPTFRVNVSVPSSRVKKSRYSRKPLDAALYPRRAQISGLLLFGDKST
jgi:hypothetical protein